MKINYSLNVGSPFFKSVVMMSLMAAPAFSQDASSLEQLVQETLATIKTWEDSARLQFYLIVLVAALGAISAVIQAINHKFTKIVTVILGATVGVLTVVNSEGFPRSHKSIWRDVEAARVKVAACKRLALRYNAETDPGNRMDLLDGITNLIKQIYDLPVRAEQTARAEETGRAVGEVWLRSIETVVHAQEARPAWITNPPGEGQFVYFIGTGKSASVSEAKASSHSDAMKKAVAAIAARSNTHGAEATAALYPYVERTATVADSYLEWDGHQTYIHYTLLRVSRALANSQAVGALSQQRVDPWLQLSAKRRALGESRVSTAGRANPFNATVAVKSTDPHDGYFDLKFSIRRNAGRLVVRLVEIKAIQDGSSGKASWQFEVQTNGQPAFTVRSRNYDDDLSAVVFSASEPVETSIGIGANQVLLITVRASRT